MFEWFKKLFHAEIEEKDEIKTENKGPVLVTIHGFGVRRSAEMDQFVSYCKDWLPQVITFDMFDIEDENDNDPHAWIERAKKQLDLVCKENENVYLLGFSMGGVIASYLATLYPVKKLILIAPAFIHFSLENYYSIAKNEASKLVFKNKPTKPKLPKSFYNSFLEVVKEYKSSIGEVQCPVLLIQGDEDEVIPPKSSVWGYEQIQHDQKKLVFLHEGKHRILDDEKVKDVAYLLIQNMICDEILPIETIKTEE